MARPVPAPRDTLAACHRGEHVRLAEDTPAGGDDSRRWIPGGSVALITGRASGGWTMLRLRDEAGRWLSPVTVPSSARVSAVLAERPEGDDAAGDRGGADVADPLQRATPATSPLLAPRGEQ